MPHGCQQNLLHLDKDTQAILEYLCSESNKLHNCTVYYARQIWFKTRKFVTGFDLVNEMNRNRHFQAMANEISVQTCIAVGESVKSFSKLLKRQCDRSDPFQPRKP